VLTDTAQKRAQLPALAQNARNRPCASHAAQPFKTAVRVQRNGTTNSAPGAMTNNKMFEEVTG